MGVSRNFKGISLRDGSLLVEGFNSDDDDVSNESLLELRVIVVSLPGHEHMVQTSTDPLGLGDPDWDVPIPDVPPPFDSPGPVLAIGFAKYRNAHGDVEEAVWGTETEIA